MGMGPDMMGGGTGGRMFNSFNDFSQYLKNGGNLGIGSGGYAMGGMGRRRNPMGFFFGRGMMGQQNQQHGMQSPYAGLNNPYGNRLLGG